MPLGSNGYGGEKASEADKALFYGGPIRALVTGSA